MSNAFSTLLDIRTQLIHLGLLPLQVIPTNATHLSVVQSACLSQSCTLVKLFDGSRCHMAGPIISPDPQGKERFGGPHKQPKHAITYL